jgi:hypothetical protein
VADIKFTELVKKYFRFLVDEFGFSVANEEHNRQMFGDRVVEYRSPTTVVTVSSEGFVLTEFGPASEPHVAHFLLFNVISFFDAKLAEAEKSALGNVRQPRRNQESQIARSAELLHQFGEPMLKGDFTQWNEIGQYIDRIAHEKTKASTGRELGPTALTDYLKSKGVSVSNHDGSR